MILMLILWYTHINTGRPNTMNAENVMQFLDENGKPSSPLIVEGANIFITKEARQILYEKGGVPIVKDSSANKCGVITSSCEVMASMLLSKEEFMQIKPELVRDVISDLHFSARAEAELLFKEYRNYPGNESSGVYICNSIVNYLRHGNYMCK